MIQAMQGVLADNPEINELIGPDGRQFTLAKANLLYRDGRNGPYEMSVRILAWNDQAEHLAKYDVGEEIQFIGRMNVAGSLYDSQAKLSFTVHRIDDSKTLISAVENFLREFAPSKEKLSDKIKQAESQKSGHDVEAQGTQQDIHYQ